MKSLVLAAALLGAASSHSLAAAVTYAGTLGGQPIIIELTEPKDPVQLGRYSYQSRGIDIPLHGVSASKYDVNLAEEAPCTPALCLTPDGELVSEPPLGGQFTLHYSADDTRLTGTWRASATATSALDVDLTRIGERVYQVQELYPYDSFLWHNYEGADITPVTSPYDFAKLQAPQREGPLQTMNGATYLDLVDPRTKFAFPVVVALPGGGDVAPVNAMLAQQRWATSLAGFECLAQDYLSGGWSEQRQGNGYSPLGDIDQEHISVEYLSATVMSISQGGSIYCGGASPHNHIDYYTFDVRRGGALELSRIFKDWDGETNRPRQALIDWVIAAYPKMPDYDADYAADCEINENFAEHLDVSFSAGETATFLIGGIDQAACMGAMVSVPLAEIRELLTSEAADYFPSLKAAAP